MKIWDASVIARFGPGGFLRASIRQSGKTKSPYPGNPGKGHAMDSNAYKTSTGAAILAIASRAPEEGN